MRIDISQRERVGADDDFYAFAQTHVSFATFHPTHSFDDCRLELYVDGPGTARCGLSVVSPELGTIEAGAVGEDAYDVVARAAQLLEVEVDRRIERHERLRERRARLERQITRLPLHSARPAPQPSAAIWAEIG